MNKKLLLKTVMVGIIITSLFAGYYFGIYSPKNKTEIIEQQKKWQVLKERLENDRKIQEQSTMFNEKDNDFMAYGVLRHFSNAGAMTFEYYDIESNSVLNKKDRPWFWADSDMDNREEISDFVSLIDENRDSVFKIIGRKRKDNCAFEKGVCLEDIHIDEISIVGKANLPKRSDIDYSQYEGGQNDETKKMVQGGFIDGFYDAIDIHRLIKQGYIEPDAQDFLKNVYYYGYLSGYETGCDQANLISKDCEIIPKLLDELSGDSEQDIDIYMDSSIGTII